MKIALLGDCLGRSRGGTEALAYHLAETLAATGHAVQAIAMSVEPLPADAMPPGVDARRLDASSASRVPVVRHFRRARAMTRMLRELGPDAEAFWCFSYETVLAASRVARGRPVLFLQPQASAMYRRLYPETWGPRDSTFGKLLHAYEIRRTAVLERRAMARCTALVYPSRSRRDEILESCGEEFRPKCRVVPLGVDLAAFTPSGLAWDPTRPLRTLSVCRLSREKNVQCLVRAAGILKRRGVAVESVVVGDGPLRAELEELAEREGARDRVAFAGAQQDVRRFYREADLFVLPSVYEGFGIVFLEALASGLPCVAIRNVPGKIRVASDEIIEPGKTGILIDDDSPELLADALMEVRRDPQRLQEWSRNARRSCEERFSWKRTVDGILEIR